MSAFDQLYEGSASAEAALRDAVRNVEELARYDQRFTESAQQLASARATISDIASALRDYAEGINASPDRLSEIEDRLALIDRLKRKYGKTVAEIIAFGEDVAGKLAEVEDRDEILKTLRSELEQSAAAYRKAAASLTADRQAAAVKLAKLAEAQINSLAMKVKFQVAVTSSESSAPAASGRHAVSGHDLSRADAAERKEGALAPEGSSSDSAHWSASGWDSVEYRISTNPGEPLKPLVEIASGGELSRVLLALKVAVEEGSSSKTKKKTTPRTLVFDEIDIGIGGRAAEAVGQKLKALARAQQVLCVTHLPQIAAFADQHLAVEKREKDGRTQTRIRVLDDRSRTHEVARMLSGAKVTDTSLQHAAQMIAGSR
jgi:DNA repair protein RecN (Recombination protein N)